MTQDQNQPLPVYKGIFWEMWIAMQSTESHFAYLFALKVFHIHIVKGLTEALESVGALDRLAEYKAAHRAAVHAHLVYLQEKERNKYNPPRPPIALFK